MCLNWSIQVFVYQYSSSSQRDLSKKWGMAQRSLNLIFWSMLKIHRCSNKTLSLLFNKRIFWKTLHVFLRKQASMIPVLKEMITTYDNDMHLQMKNNIPDPTIVGWICKYSHLLVHIGIILFDGSMILN